MCDTADGSGLQLAGFVGEQMPLIIRCVPVLWVLAVTQVGDIEAILVGGSA